MITAVLALTAIWHLLAVWHFTFHPGRTNARATRARPVSVVGAELFRFLGGMNAALVVLAAGACFGSTDTVALAAATLCVANASQLAQDVRIARSGLASGVFFAQIVVGDAVFTVANAAVWFATG